MTIPEFLSALSRAMGMGEFGDLAEIAKVYFSEDVLWNLSQITFGEEQFHAYILEGRDGIKGISREDFLGIFDPPIEKALLERVLWARQDLARRAVGKCFLFVGRVPREGARAWVMAGYCVGVSDFLVARVWRDSKTVKVDGRLHNSHPWQSEEAQLEVQPPVPYFESFSLHGAGTFSGTLANFVFSGDRSWEFTAIFALAAIMFPYVGSCGCHVELCQYAHLGGPAGIVLTARGMRRALRWQISEKYGLQAVKFLPADNKPPSWDFTLCGRHFSELQKA